MRQMRVLLVYGTRPEAIKLAPVILALKGDPAVTTVVCATGQHREMLDQVHACFDIVPDVDLNLMAAGQGLTHITTRVLTGVGELVDSLQPDWVVVQGDTTTAFAAALAAFYRQVPVAHVEAGLRTGNVYSPYPEEANRRLVSQLAAVHFAPTPQAALNLRNEGISGDCVLVTGNTVIDALNLAVPRLQRDDSLAKRFAFLDVSKRLVLVTGHRRENLESGLANVCLVLRALAERGDVDIVFPVHLNPSVQSTVTTMLGGLRSIHLMEPLDYLPFLYLMQRCYLIITDSGGVQEEAPGLGKPVLVTRDTTERPEAIEAGTARLVGTSATTLLAAARELLDDPVSYKTMARAKNPFGDGLAAARVVDQLKTWGRGRHETI